METANYDLRYTLEIAVAIEVDSFIGFYAIYKFQLPLLSQHYWFWSYLTLRKNHNFPVFFKSRTRRHI